MNLTFLNPLFLFGLAAAVLPILIHRLTRRKAITRRFSAVRLLIKSQQVMAKPQRIKHLLLLALRILSVMGLVFLMAQPLLIQPGLLSLGDEKATIVILDNSLSMGYSEDQGTRYDIAKRAAKEIIEKLKGEVLLLSTTSLNKESRWMSRAEALKGLERIPLTYAKGDPISALSLGYHGLREAKKPGEILIISDMARGDWEGFDLTRLGTVSSETSVNFLRIGGPDRDANVGVKGLDLIEGEAVVGVPCRIEVTLSNLSDSARDILVQLYLSGTKKDQKSVAIKAREEAKVYFELFVDQPGWIDGEVRISGDRLSLDDTFYFSFHVREKVKALVVDGDPRTPLRASESYYVVNALQPGGSEGSPFLTRVITEEEFSYIDVKPYEALFLLNVARPNIFKLLPVLESGRTVFIFLGDRVIPAEYNSFPLSPWRVREMQETDALWIAEIDLGRPILKSISETGAESLRGASFRRYFKIEGGTKNLLTFKNRDPLLIEAELGKGKVFLFTSTADLDWNDLPLKAAFLPFIQGLLKEAVGLTGGSNSKGIRVGEAIQWSPTGTAHGLLLPEDKALPIHAIGPEAKPGIYRASLASGEVRHSINPPHEESDLSKISPEEMRKRLGKIDMRVMEYREDVLKTVHGRKKELWPILLCFVLLVLGLEMMVAGRI